MLDTIAELTNLTPTQFGICVTVVFFAGMVRGFSGFALSALLMAGLAVMIPPVELLPICWLMEFVASLAMVRGGVREADFKIVSGLTIGGMIGSPIALYFTNTMPADMSRLIALGIILVLASLQLARVRARFLATNPGLYGSGFLAGTATGFAGVGGMVVALYVLAREAPARIMRGSLVMYLFISNVITSVYYLAYGMMTAEAMTRGALLVVPCLLGVWAGQALFRPSLEKYYRPFCLILLVGLAVFGIVVLVT